MSDTVIDEGTVTEEPDEEERDDAHLADVDDGCGCAEVWEHLSEQRGESATHD